MPPQPESSPESPDDLFLVGFDSEYVPGNLHNQLVSYQTYGIFRGKTWECFFDRRDGVRLALKAIIGQTLEAGKKEGIFNHYPETVYLCAHWSIADMTMLADYDAIKTEFDSLRKTLATVQKPMELTWTDSNRHSRVIKLFLRDSLLLAPQGKGKLEALGELHKLPKIELPAGAIERMDLLLEKDPVLFVRYAMRDAEIAAKHCLYMARLQQQWTGNCEIPITLGGLAVNYSKCYWESTGVKWREALGSKMVKTVIYTDRGPRTINRPIALPGFEENTPIAVNAYHGGRNEAFMFGVTEVGVFKDWDLAGAYSTILAMTPTPIYNKVKHTTAVEDFGPSTLGYARIEFEFPTTVRYPCFPVRTDNGLVFPLCGETYATASEIDLARRQGATIIIHEGITVPTADEYIFGDVITEITKQRRLNKKDELLNALYKEMANSLYGKTAQGLRVKMGFNNRTGQSVALSKAALTNAFVAAYVTGFIRALLAEILNALPTNRTVVSVTTDGFITDAMDAEIIAATNGPLAKVFADARQRLVGDPKVLEIKHTVQQLLCWRTRGQATLLAIEDGKPVLAKAGIKLPGIRKPDEEQNEEIIKLFVDRSPERELEIEVFRSLRDIWYNEGDLTKRTAARKVRMDYDWKRQPSSAITTREISGQAFLTFQTRPWNTVDNFSGCRQQWDIYYARTEQILDTEKVLDDFLAYLVAFEANKAGANRSIQGGDVKMAVRMVCRAFVQKTWGFTDCNLKYGEFAAVLTAGGYAITTNDLKNAARPAAVLSPHHFAATFEIRQLINFMKAKFPAFEENKLLFTGLEADAASVTAAKVEPPKLPPAIPKKLYEKLLKRKPVRGS